MQGTSASEKNYSSHRFPTIQAVVPLDDTNTQMSDNELLCHIALTRIPDIGIVTARTLLNFFGSAEKVLSADYDTLVHHADLSSKAAETLISERNRAKDTAAKELAFISQHRLRTLSILDDEYPESLRAIHDAPILLYGKGNFNFKGHLLSIVGTRTCTDRGRQLCHDFVVELSRRVPDLTIISGLAYGIDIASHRAALECGIHTIGVLAHGLDRIYPAVNRQTAIEMVSNGGLLTEYPSGTEPERMNFVARNRIVAGLSSATIVIESKQRGGSLITAQLAFENGRDVFAFPGRPQDALSAGCNNLIRRNIAGLITSADDFLEATGWADKGGSQTSLETQLFAELSNEESQVMSSLRKYEDGVPVNTIVSETGMTFAEVSTLLFSLELKNMVRSLPGGQYRAC